MRSSSLLHLTLGTIVTMVAGLAGHVASLEPRTTKPRACERQSRAQYPCSSKPAATWDFEDVALGVSGPQRLIVKYRGSRLTGTIARELLGGGSMHSAIEPAATPLLFDALTDVAVLSFRDGATADAALARLQSDPRVVYAERDAMWHVDAGAPSDARYAEQWGLENTGQAVNGHAAGLVGVDIDAPNAWQHGKGSEDVVVAVIDSGVDYGHEDLVANMWINEGETPGNGVDDDGNGVVDDVHGFNAIDGSGDPDDDIGHGTHVAGIMGAAGDNGRGVAGVNWTTRIMALKFLGPAGGGTTSDAIACIDYLLEMKARGVNVRVANCSWGGTAPSKALGDAIERANKQGILFVCAAGNNSTDTDRVPHYPSSYDLEGVLSVAALASNDTMASFSNWGAESVDIAAPGVDVLSTLPDGSYGFASGTSMASPFVAGVAALVAEQDPKMSISKMRSRVLDGVTDVPDFAKRLVTGGRLSGSGAFK